MEERSEHNFPEHTRSPWDFLKNKKETSRNLMNRNTRVYVWMKKKWTQSETNLGKLPKIK